MGLAIRPGRYDIKAGSGRSAIRHRLGSIPLRIRLSLILLGILAPVWGGAHAAQIDGVQLPPTLQEGDKTLQLNGFGLRTYSILGIHIYIVGLYLEHLNTNAAEILQSPETKLLIIRFEHGVSASAARGAWRTGLANNCTAPCHLDPQDVERFLDGVPAMHAGETFSLLFSGPQVTIFADGKQLAVIAQPDFAEAMLATFLGDRPASSLLRADLLQGHG